MNKIKVVWICHFSNTEIREKLPLSKKGKNISDFALWITNMIIEFKKFEDIELHIISPHRGLKQYSYSFEKDGICYYFYKDDMPFFHRNWPSYFQINIWTNYFISKLIVRRIIKKINPDIINLHGAENPYYSSTALNLKGIPILITIQGIYSNPERNKYENPNLLRCKIEREIHSQNKYFGVSAPYMPSLIKRDVENPILFWTDYPKKMQQIINTNNNDKCYDFVFFGQLKLAKGIYDTLDALALVKKYKPDVKLRMMGQDTQSRLNDLIEYSKKLGLENNVIISEGYKLHEDMINEASKAKNYILPTRFDTLPSSIFEAIYLGLPVVSYLSGEIPLLNKGDIRALLCEIGDIHSLANNMILLLEKPETGKVLSQKANEFVDKWFNNRTLALNFVDQYRSVLEHFHNEKPVPSTLLYENFMNEIN
jgi:glycosyltransferase involved in cell wall biosynthesis